MRATAQLSHWNTILIFDYGRNDDGVFYYAMEYLPGLSLDDLIRRYGPMPPARVIYLLRQACDALHEAHEAGLVHRDIKPANLFAAYRGGLHDVTKLLDFGLVKTLQGGDGLQLSREDTVAGSPLYIAPEQVVHSQPPDRRADIYSLGAVAYFLLTGHPPFKGETAMEVMIAHTRDPVAPPSELHPGVPADLEEVVLRCLAKKPSDRYPGHAEPGRGPRRVRRRRGLVAPARRGVVACPPGRVAARAGGLSGRDHARRIRLGRERRVDRRRFVLGPRVGHIPAAHVSCTRPASSPRRPDAMPPIASPHEPSDERASLAWLTEPLDTTIHLAFAFDVGDEIDLDRARLILQGEPGQLPRRRRTPESIGYRPAPIRVDVEPAGIRLPGDWEPIRPPRGELTLFDFGAISLSVRFPMTASPAELLELAGALAEPAPLTDAARELLAPWLRADRAGRPRLRRQRDERGVHRLSARRAPARLAGSTRRLDRRAGPARGRPPESGRGPRGHPAGTLIHAHRPRRARLGGRVRRRHRLRRHACRSSSSPTSSSWNSATSTTGSTTGSRPPTGSSGPSARPRRWPRFWRLHGDAVRQIREMEIEATSLFERVDNALKLIGDHYLARVFEVASARFHLRDWQQSIRRKLETVGDVYDLLVQQAGGQRMEALEITVVVLIALEIVLAVLRH